MRASPASATASECLWKIAMPRRVAPKRMNSAGMPAIRTTQPLLRFLAGRSLLRRLGHDEEHGIAQPGKKAGDDEPAEFRAAVGALRKKHENGRQGEDDADNEEPDQHARARTHEPGGQFVRRH